ncbi:thioredoxin family protein [Candidatus Woesearchaeota archaeon]|nr:thioredoxin family protein [Candidatus Woesearchaeota archaeon]
MAKKLLILLGIILVLAGGFLAYRWSAAEDYTIFATCLTEKGVVMYGTDWCPHCQKQKKMFGGAFKNVLFVDCDKSPECDTVGVKAYPTWFVNGKLLDSGVQQLETLSKLSGCPLPP